MNTLSPGESLSVTGIYNLKYGGSHVTSCGAAFSTLIEVNRILFGLVSMLFCI